jgi:hypothetical protein
MWSEQYINYSRHQCKYYQKYQQVHQQIQETIERRKVGSSDGFILEYTSLLLTCITSVPLPEFREGPGGSMS